MDDDKTKKTSTYMGFPNHFFLLAQWTSEKMNLETGEEGGGGMDDGRGTQQSKSNKKRQIKWKKTLQDNATKSTKLCLIP